MMMDKSGGVDVSSGATRGHNEIGSGTPCLIARMSMFLGLQHKQVIIFFEHQIQFQWRFSRILFT